MLIVRVAQILLPLLTLYLFALVLYFSGTALHSVVSFFSNLWDFVLYVGVAAAALGLAIGVILVRSPIHALFCLIGVFINSIFLLLSIRVEFLSMILLIVYIGAIAILFLFVIMLLDLNELQSTGTRWGLKSISAALVFAALSLKGYSFLINGIYTNSYYNKAIFSGFTDAGFSSVEHIDYYFRYGLNDVTLFSELLYTSHAPLFLLSSLVLLASMTGAIVLAMSTIEK